MRATIRVKYYKVLQYGQGFALRFECLGCGLAKFDDRDAGINAAFLKCPAIDPKAPTTKILEN